MTDRENAIEVLRLSESMQKPHSLMEIAICIAERESYLTEEEEATLREAVDLAIQVLEQTRWILCSEKSPNKNERLALLYDNGLVSGGKYLGDRTYDVDFPDQNKKTRVVAWMPLPQPYKGESEAQDENID